MQCADVADLLADASAGSVLLSARARLHVEHCLRCQAEMVQYRRVLRALRAMRTDVLAPAPGLLPEVLAALEAAGERRAVRSLINGRRVAYAGGIAAATAAGVGGALVLASRSRRRPVLAR